MSAEITLVESKRLVELEKVIKAGKKSFVEVGNALSEIRDQKLYRTDHKTFEEYCQQKWGWTRRHSNRLIEASSLVSEMGPIGPKIESESQARELAKVQPAKRVEVIEKAQSKADKEERPITAKDVKEAATEVCPPERKPAVRLVPTEGMIFAKMAISQLERIHPSDTQRVAALNYVLEWVNDQLK